MTYQVRRDEYGNPVIVVQKQIQLLCHDLQVEQPNSNGGALVPIKMRPTKPFLDNFNFLVVRLLEHCMLNAHTEGRTTLMEKDVPSLDILPDEDDDGDAD